VGCNVHDFDNATILKTQVYARYVKPGKHSIFVYDPQGDRLFMKIVVVEEPRTWEATPNLDIELEMAGQSKCPQKDQRSILANEAFLEDTQPGTLELSKLLKSEADIRTTLEAIDSHY